jgi:hypothetical protein
VKNHLSASSAGLTESMGLGGIGQGELLPDNRAQATRIDELGQFGKHGSPWRREHEHAPHARCLGALGGRRRGGGHQ